MAMCIPEADYRNPQVTLDLLDSLEARGLDQDRFWRLHHTQKTASIGGHRTYSKRILAGPTKRFWAGGGNEETAMRMAVCLQQLEAGESWETAIARALLVMPFSGPRGFLPTADDDEFQRAVAELATHAPPKEPPAGELKPRRIPTSPGFRFERDPNVADWVFRRAAGVCEHCRSSAPFTRADGTPFLEIHHVVRLADGGSDRRSNAVALCPNCHRLMHHSAAASSAIERLYATIAELIREVPHSTVLASG